MIRRHPWRILIGALIAAVTLASGAFAAAARAHHDPVSGGAPSKSYRGRTSQKQKISFTISGGFVRNLNYFIIDRCTARSRVSDHDRGFPPMQIKHSRFGGTFHDPTHGATAVISGTLFGQRVKGSLTDTVKFRRHTCHGSASFNLTPS
jgi:hypothetical protein